MATAEVVAVAEAVEEASEVVVAVAVAVPVAVVVTNESPVKTKCCKLGGFDQALVLKKGMNEAT